MALVLSIVAIVISLAGFAFNVFQFISTRRLKSLEKTNELYNKALSLRKLSMDIRNKAATTDHTPDMDHVFDALDNAIESKFLVFLSQKKPLTMSAVLELEQGFASLHTEFELLSKQVDVQRDFNEEVKALGQ
jgi:hypothetical protein